MLWMDKNASEPIKQKSQMMEKLQLLDDSTTKQARTTSTRGIEVGVLNR